MKLDIFPLLCNILLWFINQKRTLKKLGLIFDDILGQNSELPLSKAGKAMHGILQFLSAVTTSKKTNKIFKKGVIFF